MAKAPQVTKTRAVTAISSEVKAGIPALVDDPRGIIESVLIRGDLSQMTPAQRTDYYMRVCQSVGLNPLTKPFEYIILNGKLTLYALRGCTDQLRTIHDVSVLEAAESERDGVFIVTTKVQNGKGRTDMAKGAVNIQGLKGEALANALMKAETKAKRRATLSLCGLGFLDESEIESIPSSAIQRVPSPDATVVEVIEGQVVETPAEPQKQAAEKATPKAAPKAADKPKASPAPKAEPEKAMEPEQAKTEAKPAAPHEISLKGLSFDDFLSKYLKCIETASSADELLKWRGANQKGLAILQSKKPEFYDQLVSAETQVTDNLGDRVIEGEIMAPEKPGEETHGDASERAKTADMPDPEKDPEAFVQWASKILATFKNVEAAQDWINEVVEPIRPKLFPPDYEEIIGAFTRLEEKLAP